MAGRGRQQPAHGRERIVATGVAALVVDPLQVVEVEQQQGERVLAALGVRDQAGQLLLEGAMVAQPGQGIEQRGQPRPVVLLAEVVAGCLEPLGRRQDGAGQEDHQERQRHADDDHPEQGDEGVELALAGLEVAEHGPEDDLRHEDDRQRHDHAAADRCHPAVIGLGAGLAVPVEHGHVRLSTPMGRPSAGHRREGDVVARHRYPRTDPRGTGRARG